MPSQITISWNKSPAPVTSYNVYRGTAVGNESATAYATGVVAPAAMSLTSVAAAANGNTVYTGTIANGAGDALAGIAVVMSGFADANNNGTFLISASTSTTLTLNNGAGQVDAGGSAAVNPYYVDLGVFPGHVYSYEITAVANGAESADSLGILSGRVPFIDPAVPSVALSTGSSFSVLGGSTVTNAGTSQIAGDVGVFPGTSITGFGAPTSVGGILHSGDFVSQAAQISLTAAMADAASRTPNATPLLGDIGGTTIYPGVYFNASSVGITGTLTLDGQGDPSSTWIFQIGSTLTTAVTNSTVLCINGANPDNIFWLVGSSATLNGGTYFAGTVMAQASITAGVGAIVNGRLLASAGAVTLGGNDVLLQLQSPLTVYSANNAYALGAIVYDCASNTFQQVVQAGVTGNSVVTFSNTVGSLTTDGSVVWYEINPSFVFVESGMTPSPPNVPPSPPAAPTGPVISSEG